MFTGCAPPAPGGTGIDPNHIRVHTAEHGAAPAHAAAKVPSARLDGAESVL
ncbi:hypothetical protein [Streptomyces sp. NPDC050388]|uniref:hypothetical protein n=1 Tax=Streptomyces sp. NPDC050388 TaxID=3155781 RepID=UPI00343A5A09